MRICPAIRGRLVMTEHDKSKRAHELFQELEKLGYKVILGGDKQTSDATAQRVAETKSLPTDEVWVEGSWTKSF
jgi:hypothetical protein